MGTLERLDSVIANALRINVSDVTDELAFQSIPAWDSLTHVTLMLLLEEVYDIKINDDEIVELISVREIRDFIERRSIPPTAN